MREKKMPFFLTIIGQMANYRLGWDGDQMLETTQVSKYVSAGKRPGYMDGRGLPQRFAMGFLPACVRCVSGSELEFIPHNSGHYGNDTRERAPKM